MKDTLQLLAAFLVIGMIVYLYISVITMSWQVSQIWGWMIDQKLKDSSPENKKAAPEDAAQES